MMDRACARHNRGKAGPFRCWNTAEVEVVNQGPHPGETPVSLECEAGHEYLEGHFRVQMSEFGTIEIKAERLLRAILRTLQPQKFCIGVDETSDEPRRGNPIDPQAFSRRPSSSTIVFALAPADFVTRR